MSSLADLFQHRDTILLDGAMGTELLRRGVDISLPLWSARALETAPEVVQAIHQDYLTAGARLITANTFRTTTVTYQRAGLDECLARKTARRAAQLAVSLAREAARDHHQSRVLVAGSVAPVGDCYTPGDYPGADVARKTYRELAEWLAAAGVDLLLIETHITLEETLIALAAAADTGLPVLVSYLIDSDLKLWGGVPLSEAVGAAEEKGARGIMVNCVTLPVAQKGVEALSKLTALPCGAYANAGRGQPTAEGIIEEFITDEEYAAAARGWLQLGARMIGGCCGTTPHTIAYLHRFLRTCESP
ncbi:MAG: homocysteine S-methyltransferase family protein [Fidelibacterota bacterium]|nr:MAG: homocysteine S-methyltransferase family protein [Candidatus Neomarinimicrobiota bacterium]